MRKAVWCVFKNAPDGFDIGGLVLQSGESGQRSTGHFWCLEQKLPADLVELPIPGHAHFPEESLASTLLPLFAGSLEPSQKTQVAQFFVPE